MRTTEDTREAFRKWAKPDDVIESFYADNAPELTAAAKSEGWRMPTSTPGVPESNGLAERKVRKTKRENKGKSNTGWA